jgi:hypothetical protein
VTESTIAAFDLAAVSVSGLCNPATDKLFLLLLSCVALVDENK